MVASYFQNVAMDLVNFIVFEVFILGKPLFLYLEMEVIDVLSYNTHLFVFTFEYFKDLRKCVMTFVRFSLAFYLIKVVKPIPCFFWMLIVKG